MKKTQLGFHGNIKLSYYSLRNGKKFKKLCATDL